MPYVHASNPADHRRSPLWRGGGAGMSGDVPDEKRNEKGQGVMKKEAL